MISHRSYISSSLLVSLAWRRGCCFACIYLLVFWDSKAAYGLRIAGSLSMAAFSVPEPRVGDLPVT